MDFKEHPKTQFKEIRKLSREQARAEIEALREGIEYHDYQYYVKDQPVISDETYDKLFRRLQELEQAFPEFDSENSPTKRVGGEPASQLTKVRHAGPMLSLSAVYRESEVEGFDRMLRRELGSAQIEYVAEPKFDGLSVEVVYEEGTFVRGTTRGDGETGEDISRNIRTIRAVPLHLAGGKQKLPALLAVRGEVFMRKDDFQRLNKQRLESGEVPFANPRNAAAGTVRQLDPRKVAHTRLDIIFYDILELRDGSFRSHGQMLEQFPRWGLKTDPHNRQCPGLEQVKNYHAQLAAQRDELEYEIDGIVVKVNDYEAQERLGMRQRSPRWALAWKFEPKHDVTTLKDIVVQVGRTGILTPVGLLEPVNVGGVTVSRATLHNEGEVRRKDVRPGDQVRIERAGDVIPEVVERVGLAGPRRGKPFSMPKHCPSCGAKVYQEGAYHYCPNILSCRAQLAGRIAHYASREAMNIEHLGKRTVEELVQRGMVKSIADLYRLSVADLRQLPGFAQKSATQLYNAIQQNRKVRLDRFLYALGIHHVGAHAAQALARHFRTFDALREASREDLAAVPEVGRVVAQSLYSFLQQEQTAQVLGQLRAAGLEIEPMPSPRAGRILAGKIFVLTGELEAYTRAEAKRRIEDLGGRVVSSVSGRTDYLVVGREPGSKLEEARKKNVEIVDEKGFRKLIGS